MGLLTASDRRRDLSRIRWLGGIRRGVREACREFRFGAEEIIDAGESVVVFSRNTGLAKSGVRLDVRAVQVLTFRDGKVINYRYFGEDRAACLQAVGLVG